ncbi:CTAG/Pcc1 family [Coniella lustricola]|uniref:CTAG/Pcc1 family n=1 Tax=Coniella lustricola TaxID=2025994 RepID=A0A2T3AMK5_9PEZI|nr:CTAG/Pcc1 family [Coniella lustricola]
MSRDVDANEDGAFPCSLILNVPFPTRRLSSIAMEALAVDKELSPLVQRRFSTIAPEAAAIITTSSGGGSSISTTTGTGLSTSTSQGIDDGYVLQIHYRATTNRMLRVAVNSFMDSLALILEVMEKLDVDVLEAQNAD